MKLRDGIRKYGARLRRTGFRSDKTLERLDFDFDLNIDRALINTPTSRRFHEKVSVLITGLCGTGKSFSHTQVIGHCAVRQGIDVLFRAQTKLLT